MKDKIPMFTVGNTVWLMLDNKATSRQILFVLKCENTIYYGLTYADPVIYGQMM